ncbi:alpha/beta hydrolase [Nocardioides panacihumi]|uniref:Alpha/beta hydrolase n=1 Tax=Nocardioides panacihumi TaxID=400774 RepID=A0ABN2QI77_9ACTN
MSSPAVRLAVRRDVPIAVGILALLAVVLSSCGSKTPSSVESPVASQPHARIEFAPGLTEDLYLPEGVSRAPLVVLVPGGGWQTADPSGLAPLAASLADAGIAAAPTHIRAAEDGVVYPVPVEDVLCAVSAAVQGARERGVTPDRVAVLGHSSGAHLAALAVLAAADYAPRCRCPVVTPDALIGLSGPYDISRIPEVAQPLLGDAPDADPEVWASANPLERAHLRPQVPVLLLHGEADLTVPSDFTTQFARVLEDAGHPTTVRLLPDADHQTVYSAAVASGPVAAWLSALPAEPTARPSGQVCR